MTPAARIDQLIALNDTCDILGEWDQRFLASLQTQIGKRRSLSMRQNDILQKIEAKLSPQALSASEDWAVNWNAEKRETAAICAAYYVENGYFVELAHKILRDPAWIVPRKQYDKMCGNKYAQAVLTATRSKPLYPEGSIVTLRATAKSALTTTRYHKFKEKPLFILEVLPQVRRAAKGAKLYS